MTHGIRNPDAIRFELNTCQNSDTDASSFYTGKVADGKLAFVIHLFDGYLIVWFSADGQMVGTEHLEVPRDPDIIASGEYGVICFSRLLAWRQQVGYVPGPIEVSYFCVDQPFCITVQLIGIRSTEFVTDPYADEDRVTAASLLNSGYRGGHFLIIIGRNDYFSYETANARYTGHAFVPTVEELLRPPYTPPCNYLPGYDPRNTHLCSHGEQLYLLRPPAANSELAFFTPGRLSDGTQAIAGIEGGEAVCVRFDEQGTYLSSMVRALPLYPGKMRPNPHRPDHEEPASLAELTAWYSQEATKWQAEIGLVPSEVRVRLFLYPDERNEAYERPRRIYIQRYPRWALILLHDPFFYADREERNQLYRDLADWEASGSFIFWWGKDHQMSKDGEVLST
jgi:hypothetical protein